jgi:hypothetical protein
MNPQTSLAVVAVCLGLSLGTIGRAQELETRCYMNRPIGLNFFQVGYGRSDGNVLIDPSPSIEGLNADLDPGGMALAATLLALAVLAARYLPARRATPIDSDHYASLRVDQGRETCSPNPKAHLLFLASLLRILKVSS